MTQSGSGWALGLQDRINLIALGVVMCVLASAGIAALACGLAPALRSRLVVGGLLWLVMADAAFFDTYASPYSEGATLIGLLLLAAGLIYLGRGKLASAAGLALAAGGGALTIMSKEQYLPLVAPICVGLLLAAVARGGRRGLDRFLAGRMAATVIAVGLIAAASVAYAQQDASSPYTRQLHQIPAAFFAGIEPARHMLGMNMATALAFASGRRCWPRCCGSAWPRMAVRRRRGCRCPAVPGPRAATATLAGSHARG